MWRKVLEFVFGPRMPSVMPERVRQTIAKQQQDGEILIGWVQLFMVSFFGTLYAISPKTSAVTGATPVVWALSLYFVFTLARLALAYRAPLPTALLVGSVVMDMGLLMVLIWSFHLQYQQPPSFYLKVPTVMYVFIFIALRALRFEVTYIVLAGGIAAVGWFLLVLYVVFSDPTNPMITRNFVEYMTSNSVLIGAEVDKILTILVVTAVLAVAVLRAQRQMVRSVVDHTAAEDLSRFVSPEIATRVTSADEEVQPGDGEVKVATVLFTDIEGFSGISEHLEPNELMQTLNEYFAAVSQVIDRYGGVITQYEGDSMLITFNTPHKDPDHAANAVRTALGIQGIVTGQAFGEGIPMKTRCGINTGEVIGGAVGTKDRLLFTVHGDEVNVAARLEQLNKEHGTYILASDCTVKEAGDAFDFDRVGEITVRGRKAKVAVYTIRS